MSFLKGAVLGLIFCGLVIVAMKIHDKVAPVLDAKWGAGTVESWWKKATYTVKLVVAGFLLNGLYYLLLVQNRYTWAGWIAGMVILHVTYEMGKGAADETLQDRASGER